MWPKPRYDHAVQCPVGSRTQDLCDARCSLKIEMHGMSAKVLVGVSQQVDLFAEANEHDGILAEASEIFVVVA